MKYFQLLFGVRIWRVTWEVHQRRKLSLRIYIEKVMKPTNKYVQFSGMVYESTRKCIQCLFAKCMNYIWLHKFITICSEVDTVWIGSQVFSWIHKDLWVRTPSKGNVRLLRHRIIYWGGGEITIVTTRQR